MGALIPTPVTLENLIDVTSDINIVNDGIVTQLVSPRTKGAETVTVGVKDDVTSPAYHTGTCDANVLNSISDSSEDFVAAGIVAGDYAVADVSGLSAVVTVVATGVLTLDADICPAGTETYTIRKPTYWVQKHLGGEWVKSNVRTGNDDSTAYTLPVNTASTVVHGVVYPIALAAIATYPPITSA